MKRKRETDETDENCEVFPNLKRFCGESELKNSASYPEVELGILRTFNSDVVLPGSFILDIYQFRGEKNVDDVLGISAGCPMIDLAKFLHLVEQVFPKHCTWKEEGSSESSHQQFLAKIGIKRNRQNKLFWVRRRTSLKTYDDPTSGPGGLNLPRSVCLIRFFGWLWPYICISLLHDYGLPSNFADAVAQIIFPELYSDPSLFWKIVPKKAGAPLNKLKDEEILAIEKAVDGEDVKVDVNLKKKMQRRWDRLVSIIGPVFSQLIEVEGLCLPSLSFELRDSILGLSVLFDEKGNILREDFSKCATEKKWLQDYYLKLLLGLSNDTYRNLCQLKRLGCDTSIIPDFTPLSTIYDNVKLKIREMNKMGVFRIVPFYEDVYSADYTESNTSGDKKPSMEDDPNPESIFTSLPDFDKNEKRQRVKKIRRYRDAGLQAGSNVQNMILAIKRNPSHFVEVIESTKKELSKLDSLRGGKREFNLYKERREYKQTPLPPHSKFGMEVETCVSIGCVHDGAKNPTSKKKLFGASDRLGFELGLFTFTDSKHKYRMSNFMIWFLLFLDLSKEKMQELSTSLVNPWADLLKTTLVIEMPAEYAAKLSGYTGQKPTLVKMSFCLNWNMDQKAMKFYGVENSRSARVKVTSSASKTRPFLKTETDIHEVLMNNKPDEVLEHARELCDMYLVSNNLKLLKDDPNRKDLKIPFDLNDPSKILWFMDRIIDEGTDNLHGVIALQRWTLTFLERLVLLLEELGALTTGARKKYYEFWIKYKVYQYDDIFGAPHFLDVVYDFQKRLKLSKTRNTVKGMKYRHLFSRETCEKFFECMAEFVEDQQESKDVFKLTKEAVTTVFCNLFNFCDKGLMKDELLSDDDIKMVGVYFDHIYIFIQHGILVTGNNCHYVLEWLTTLPLDLFFKRSLSKNGMSIPELFNFISRGILSGNTVAFKKIGMRKDKFPINPVDLLEILKSVDELGDLDPNLISNDLLVYSTGRSKVGDIAHVEAVIDLSTKFCRPTSDTSNNDEDVVMKDEGDEHEPEDGIFDETDDDDDVKMEDEPPTLLFGMDNENPHEKDGDGDVKMKDESPAVVPEMSKNLDLFSNMSLQVLLPLMAKTMDIFFKDEVEGVNVKAVAREGSNEIVKELKSHTRVEMSQSKCTDPVILRLLTPFYKTCHEWLEKVLELKKSRRKTYNFTNKTNEVVAEKEKDFQKAFVDVLIDFYKKSNQAGSAERENVLLAWLPGVGKSLPILHFCVLLLGEVSMKHSIVCVPPAMLPEWKEKFKYWCKFFFPTHTQCVFVAESSEDFRKIENKVTNRIVLTTHKVLRNVCAAEKDLPANSRDVDLFKKFCCVMYDEIHLSCQGTMKSRPSDARDRTIDILHFAKKNLLDEKCVIVGMTGTPYRNDDCFLNTSNFLWDSGFKYELEKSISETVRTRAFREIPDLVKKMKAGGKFKDNAFFRKPEKEEGAPKLFNFVMNFEPTKGQQEQLPQGKPSISTQAKYCAKSVDSQFYSPQEWNGKKEKLTNGTYKITKGKKKLKYPWGKKVLKIDGGKLETIKMICEHLRNNSIDETYAKKLLEMGDDEELTPNTTIPSGAYEKVLVICRYPSILKQIKHWLVDTSQHEYNENVRLLKAEGNRKAIKELPLPLGNEHFFFLTGDKVGKKRSIEFGLFKKANFAIGLVSTKVGSVGLTITEARHVIQVHPDWDHTWFLQSVARAYRRGQERDVYNYLFLTHGRSRANGERDVLDTAIIKHAIAELLMNEKMEDIDILDRSSEFEGLDNNVRKFLQNLISRLQKSSGVVVKLNSYSSLLSEVLDKIEKKTNEGQGSQEEVSPVVVRVSGLGGGVVMMDPSSNSSMFNTNMFSFKPFTPTPISVFSHEEDKMDLD